ncbi:choice-of-anchor Q domain-containing protein [Marinicella litoralis]|uniref:CSLREA domain-containing protein n=1 Tax=Marinicella litoralis TaxID=644220 RepID=A0A4R6XS04_9GAMM|nr:choice-of-anchor Q domain-containing protein [Marinicella litoralis]TDR20717.1 hypothetical protein C8D91_1695 [Marinicella litoralis]
MNIKKLLMIALIFFFGQAHALTFQVIALGDDIDNNPGDGVCEIPIGFGFCSLRAAIIEANALGGSHTIELAAGVHELTIMGEENDAFAGDLNVNNADITVIGQGVDATVIDGNQNFRIFNVANNGMFNILNLTLTAGRAGTVSANVGGAMLISGNMTQVNIDNVKVVSNSANIGGGLFISLAEVFITNAQFVDNFTENLGFTNIFGPAIYCSSCDLGIDSSTFQRNNLGGKAIELDGGSLFMTNSTMTDNSGGGIRTTNSDAVIRFSTFVSDTAQNLSHFSFDDSQFMNIGHSILYTDPAAFIDNCQSGDKPTSAGYNIVNDVSCEFSAVGDAENTDAMLSGLSNHGGPTDTFLPLTGSPAIDLVPNAACLNAYGNLLLIDQRGDSRPNGISCDAGSVEVNQDVIFGSGFD